MASQARPTPRPVEVGTDSGGAACGALVQQRAVPPAFVRASCPEASGGDWRGQPESEAFRTS